MFAAARRIALPGNGGLTFYLPLPTMLRGNILVLMAARWVNTPAFDRVAHDGILFNNAYTPNAKCAPSRACILTGRNSWLLEEAANHSPDFPAKFKTYVEALGEHGYFTGSVAKGWAPGNPGQINGKEQPAYRA